MKNTYKTLTSDKTSRLRRTLTLLLALVIAISAVNMPAIFADGEDSSEGEQMQPKNGITKIEDLNNKTIGVQTGVLYEDEIKDEIEGEEWMYYKMPNDMIAALEANKIDAYLIEEVGFYAQRYEHPELMRLEEKAGQSEFAVIVGKCHMIKGDVITIRCEVRISGLFGVIGDLVHAVNIDLQSVHSTKID